MIYWYGYIDFNRFFFIQVAYCIIGKELLFFKLTYLIEASSSSFDSLFISSEN